jgi:hypothetical protein
MKLGREIYFTPTWTTTGKQPWLKNGSLTGIWNPDAAEGEPGFQIRLEIGSETDCGTGEWRFAAPGFTSFGTGTVWALDFGIVERSGLVAMADDCVFTPMIWGHSGRVVGLAPVTSASPWVWSHGDVLAIRCDPSSARPGPTFSLPTLSVPLPG